jgi:hypothetical protein
VVLQVRCDLRKMHLCAKRNRKSVHDSGRCLAGSCDLGHAHSVAAAAPSNRFTLAHSGYFTLLTSLACTDPINGLI